MTRHVLFLAAAYPPWPNAPATRARGFARGLARLGYEVSIVTADTHIGAPAEDAGVDVEATPWLDPRAMATRLGLRKTPLGRPQVSGHGSKVSPLLSLADRLAVPDLYFSWVPFAVAAARRKRRKDSIVYSTGPVSSHVVARLAGGRRPWVADVNDLWWGNPFRGTGAARTRIDRALEASTLAHADSLTTVNETVRSVLERRWEKPVCVVWSGFEPAEFPPRSERRKSRIRLLFAGTLYPTADLTPLLEALATGLRERLLSPERLEVAVIGGGSARFALQAERYGVSSLCRTLDRIPRAKLLRELVDADALLLPVYREQADIIQMRFFEYVGAGRPIVALGPRDHLASRIVREQGLGVSVSSAKEMGDALHRLLADPDRGLPSGDEETRRRFAWDTRIEELAQAIEDAAAGQERASPG